MKLCRVWCDTQCDLSRTLHSIHATLPMICCGTHSCVCSPDSLLCACSTCSIYTPSHACPVMIGEPSSWALPEQDGSGCVGVCHNSRTKSCGQHSSPGVEDWLWWYVLYTSVPALCILLLLSAPHHVLLPIVIAYNCTPNIPSNVCIQMDLYQCLSWLCTCQECM